MFDYAVVNCLAGRTEEALDALEKAIKFGLRRFQMDNNPDLACVSALPRYQRILSLAK